MANGLTSSIQTSSEYDPTTVGRSSALWLLGGVKWGGAVGTGVKLTYSFGSANSFYDDYADYAEPYVGYSVMSAAEKANALAAMKSYANVAAIAFTQVSDTDASAGDIRWANSTSDDTSYAWAYFPGSSAYSGDVWNNPDMATPLVNEQFYVFAHELGHALGLSHPHAEEDRITPVGPSGRDSVKYTVMSYNDYVNDSNDDDESAYYPTTLMMDDIRSIQALYGKNTAYRSGDTVYKWTAGSVVYETIWDGGGIDIIDASNQLAGVRINLTPGTFSTIGKAFFNGQDTVRDCLGIAYECNIEDAIGSAYADTLQGNALGNDLAGGAGSDLLIGGLGSDSLYGGADKVKDIFDFNAIAESKTGAARDKVYDFVSKIDKIDLGGIDANTAKAKAGDQVFTFSGTTAKANSVWYKVTDVDGDKLNDDLVIYGDVSGDAKADFEIGLVGVTTLLASDFAL